AGVRGGGHSQPLGQPRLDDPGPLLLQLEDGLQVLVDGRMGALGHGPILLSRARRGAGRSGRATGLRCRAMAKLVLLDGHSLAYRAFYALPTDLATKAGTVTNAVYGFTSMLVKLLTDERPEYLAVAFDAPARTFRDDLDPEYK